MKHPIDPTIDCIFKAVLGAENNKNLLIDFINRVVKPEVPIIHVEILNPYNEKDFLDDKLTIVDVKARDEQNQLYQVEIQLETPGYLRQRMLYTWGDLYQSQLESGGSFTELKPVIAIWLLTKNLFTNDSHFHHHFQWYDRENQTMLSPHGSIHVVELKKWRYAEEKLPMDQWYYFFKDGKNWTQLPDTLDTPEMRQAMQVLERFSERERDYHLYQARQNAIRVQRSNQILLEEALQKEQEALQKEQEALEKEQEALQKEQEASQRAAVAEKEQERLRQLLVQSGIDPDA